MKKILTQIVLRPFFYHECPHCGWRINVEKEPQTSPPKGNDIVIYAIQGECPQCKLWNTEFDVIWIIKKEKILPRM